MTIGFELCYATKMYFSHNYLNTEPQIMSLDEAIRKAERIINDYNLEYLDCVDAATGEIIFIANAHEDDEVEDCDCDFGFNPYLGCYDFDS